MDKDDKWNSFSKLTAPSPFLTVLSWIEVYFFRTSFWKGAFPFGWHWGKGSCILDRDAGLRRGLFCVFRRKSNWCRDDGVYRFHRSFLLWVFYRWVQDQGTRWMRHFHPDRSRQNQWRHGHCTHYFVFPVARSLYKIMIIIPQLTKAGNYCDYISKYVDYLV